MATIAQLSDRRAASSGPRIVVADSSVAGAVDPVHRALDRDAAATDRARGRGELALGGRAQEPEPRSAGRCGIDRPVLGEVRGQDREGAPRGGEDRVAVQRATEELEVVADGEDHARRRRTRRATARPSRSR